MASANEAIVGSQGIRVVFGGVAALDGVDLHVPAHQVFVLCGPNGSGKTTWLNALSGFVKPVAGDLLFDGRSMLHLSPNGRANLGLGRTFQNPHVLPHTRVRDILSIGLHQHDSRSWARATLRPQRFARSEREVQKEFVAVLERVGLPPSILDASCSVLSLGQLKMVDIARALLGEPQVVLMDEPTSGLNDVEVERLSEVVLGIRESGRAAVLVEHNVQFVLGLADRLAVLHHGALLAEGEPKATLKRPDVVAAYLGPRADGRDLQEASGSH